MKKTMKAIVLLISVLPLGCATIFTTSQQGVYVDSEPREAKVRSNKFYQQETTPTFINMKKGGDIYLDISKEGYETDYVQLNKTLTPSVFANLLLFELAPIGLFLDWQTGAMWNYQDKVVVKLDKKIGLPPTVTHPKADSDGNASQGSHPITNIEEKAPPVFHSFRSAAPNYKVQEMNLSGPRVGFTYLSKGSIQEVKREEDIDVGSMITQFGWQFEKGIHIHEDAPMLVFEILALIGGLDQSVHTETVFSFMGIRSKGGSEFAFGPTWYQNTTAVGYSGGTIFKYHHINIPLNLIVVPSKSGTNISLLTGFSW